MHLLRIIASAIAICIGSAAIGFGMYIICLMLPDGGEARAILAGILLLVAGALVLLGTLPVFPKKAPEAGTAMASPHSVAMSVLLITANFFVLCGLEIVALRLAQYFHPFKVHHADEIAIVLATLNAVVGACCPAVGVFRLVQREVKVPEADASLGPGDVERLHRGLANVWSGFALALISIFMPVVVSLPSLFLTLRGMRMLKGGPLIRLVSWLALLISGLTLTVLPLVLFVALMAAVIH